MAIGIKPDTP